VSAQRAATGVVAVFVLLSPPKNFVLEYCRHLRSEPFQVAMWFIVALFVIDIARPVPKETMVYLQPFTVF